MAPTAPLLLAKDICFQLYGRMIITHVSLQVHAGEIVTLIGPNGAGKTTLLRVLLGTLPVQHGSVTRADNATIGYVPQMLEVNPHLPITVERLLKLAGLQPHSTAHQRILRDTHVEGLLNTQLLALSGGERQRVLLARALMRSPQLLILDEPVQGVDIPGQIQLYAYLEQVRDETGCGILIVSHDLHMVMAKADRVLCLNQHICCEGKPEDVSRHAAFIALFGRDAGEHLALYPHTAHDHSHGWQSDAHDEGCTHD